MAKNELTNKVKDILTQKDDFLKPTFEVLTLIQKKKCFEHLEQSTKILETEKALTNYPFYAKNKNEKSK